MTAIDETPHCEIRASLWISGFDCDPDDISAHLDLQPSSVVRRGWRFLPFRDRTNLSGTNEWEFRTELDLPDPLPRCIEMGDLLRPLRTALESRIDRLTTMPPCSSRVSVEVLPRREPPEFSFAAGDLDFLDRVGLPFGIDIQTPDLKHAA